MFNKKVTVLMPVHNGEKFISQALESLLNQSYAEDYDILIIDDASNDNTINIIKSYQSDKIHLIQNKEKKQVAATLNYGLSLINSEYVVRMDADDICHKDRLKIQIDFMEKHKNITICGTMVQPITKDEDNVSWQNQKYLNSFMYYTPEVLRSILPFAFVLIHSSVVIRNSIFRQKGYQYDTTVGYIEDYDLWLKLLYQEDFYILPNCLVAYRYHDNGVSKTNLSNRIEMLKMIFSHFFKSQNIQFTEVELHHFCAIRSKIMHNLSITAIEKQQYVAWIKDKIYTCEKLAQYINPDYIRYILNEIKEE